MQKFIINIFLFLLLFFISNVFYLRILRLSDQFAKTEEFSKFRNEKFEILIGGFSLAMNGLDPEICNSKGFEAYNFALGGANIVSTKLMLNQYLLHNEPPKYFIYGTSEHYYHLIKVNEASVQGYHPVVDHFFTTPDFSIINLPIIKFKWLFKEILKKTISKKYRFEVINGHVRSTLKRYDNSTVNNSNVLSPEKYFSNQNIRDLAILCKQNNIIFIIAEMPTWQANKHKNKTEISYSQEIEAHFFDYNCIDSPISFVLSNKNDWTSDNHLNVNGAEKLTNFLLDDIKSINNSDFP